MLYIFILLQYLIIFSSHGHPTYADQSKDLFRDMDLRLKYWHTRLKYFKNIVRLPRIVIVFPRSKHRSKIQICSKI